jgi:hypothetical protein
MLPDIELSRTKINIDPKHLAAFNRICNDQNTVHISPLYPFTIVYPYILRCLSHRDMPLSIFRSLNTRNKLLTFQPINKNDTLDILIRLSDYRVVEKGTEVDAKSSIYKNNEQAWENIHTYYYRGKYGETDESFKPPRLDPIQSGEISGQFRIESKNGFRFARLTGDTNGIHYNSLYARMLGFKGAFSQPLRVVSKCLQNLPIHNTERPVLLELFFKGPVYYNQLLSLKHISRDKAFRFDLYSEALLSKNGLKMKYYDNT